MKKIEYKDLGVDVFLCKSFKDRLLGLMGKKNFNYGLQFNRCRSIHTFFMKEKLCLVLLDNDLKVVSVIKNIKPWKMLIFPRHVCSIIELPNNDYDIKVGQKLV